MPCGHEYQPVRRKRHSQLEAVVFYTSVELGFRSCPHLWPVLWPMSLEFAKKLSKTSADADSVWGDFLKVPHNANCTSPTFSQKWQKRGQSIFYFFRSCQFTRGSRRPVLRDVTKGSDAPPRPLPAVLVQKQCID